jgi:hypothetical protein
MPTTVFRSSIDRRLLRRAFLSAAVFVLTASTVYWSGMQAEQPPVRFSAVVRIVQQLQASHPTWDAELARLLRPKPEQVQRWITSDSNLGRAIRTAAGPDAKHKPMAYDMQEVRHGLDVRVEQVDADRLAITISCSGGHEIEVRQLANRLAKQFAEDYQARVAVVLGQKAARSEKPLGWAAAQVKRAESLLDDHLTAEPKEQPTQAPVPSPVPRTVMKEQENPQWASVNRDLEGLIRRKTGLLSNRMPVSAEVAAVERQIAELRRTLAGIPPRMLVPVPVSPAASGTPSPVAQGPSTERVAWAERRQQLESAVVEARAAYEEMVLREENRRPRVDSPKIAVQYAGACQRSPGVWFSSRFLMLALATAFAMAAATALVTFPVTAEQPLRSVAEIQQLLPVAVMGKLTLLRRERRIAPVAQPDSVAAWRLATGALLVLACFGALVLAFGQVAGAGVVGTW